MPHRGPERRKCRHAFTLWSSIMWIFIVVLVGIAVNRLYERTATDLRIITVQTCESVNRGRAATNEQSKLMSDFLRIAATRLEETSKGAPPKERAESLRYVGIYRTLAKSYKEIELADCRYPPVRAPG